MSISHKSVANAPVSIATTLPQEGGRHRPGNLGASAISPKSLMLGLAALVVVSAGAALLPAFKEALDPGKPEGSAVSAASGALPAVLISEERDEATLRKLFPTLSAKEIAELAGSFGLRLTKEASEGLRLTTATAETPQEPRPLPPQFGTTNYDNDKLFILKSRFPGEVGAIKEVLEPGSPTSSRFLRYGDRLRQGDLLAVVWSKDLGMQKAALVDAICALRLSKNQLERYAELYRDGALPLAVYKQQERQVQGDSGAVLTAKRTLKMWRMTDDEIKVIEAEANKIIDLKQVRDPDYEKKWAEVDITVPRLPTFTADKDTVLTLVEKNTNLHDMVDPTTIMFKLADLSRLTVWVQLPEEYLPLLRDRLQKGYELKWQIQFQADPPDTKPLELPILQVAPSIDPNVHTPMVMGYLPNKDNKHLIGQFVTATIFVSPDPNTVAVPTNALNDVEGEMLVFVEKDVHKREYMLRRVAVEHRFEDVSFVRSMLTEQDEKLSEVEVAKGRRPIQPLLPGEHVLTNGTVELTRAMENKLAERRVAQQEQK